MHKILGGPLKMNAALRATGDRTGDRLAAAGAPDRVVSFLAALAVLVEIENVIVIHGAGELRQTSKGGTLINANLRSCDWQAIFA